MESMSSQKEWLHFSMCWNKPLLQIKMRPLLIKSQTFMNKNLMNEDQYIIKNLNYLCTVHWLTQTRRTLATLLFIKLIKTRRTLATLLFIKLIKTRRTLATLLFIRLIKTLYSYHLLAPTLFKFCLCSVCQGHILIATWYTCHMFSTIML